MDLILCDELIQEIFLRLPPPSSAAVSLVSKRWLRLFRSSLSSLSLRLPPPPVRIDSLSSFLSLHSFLASLSVSSSSSAAAGHDDSPDRLLLCVSRSCPNLEHLRFVIGPVSLFPLLSLSSSCPRLSSLTVILSRPLSFRWLVSLPSLKELSLICTGNSVEFLDEFDSAPNFPTELRLESLSLSGIRAGDHGLNWIWRNCKTLKKLHFRSCEGVGDNASFSVFLKGLKALEEVELRACRPVVDGVLSKLVENLSTLSSLLVYDGGSKEGLLHFIQESSCEVRKLDLRLPLDLDNDHLFAVASNFRGLLSLRLQSCCLVTGEGLEAIGVALTDSLEDLALINCDVIEREKGLLTTLGQNLRKLRKLDLSHNDMLMDKEFTAMTGSCNGLRELNLRGCNGLTGASIGSLRKNCERLESLAIAGCFGINGEAIDLLVSSSRSLRKLEVEECKLSDVARTWAARKRIEVAV